MDLSIIVPVYNTDIKILKRCIDSVLKIDSIKIKYEILVIDDGSDEILSCKYKGLVQEVKNIQYIKTKNRGVSSARNKGISMASGEYIMFVDSDDIIYPNVFEKMDNNIYDIIIYDCCYIRENTIYQKKEINESPGKVKCDELILDFVQNGVFHSPWCKLYKREFIVNNKNFFNEKIIHGEDAIFNLELLEKSPKIFYIDRIIYGYFYDDLNEEKRWDKYPEKMLFNYIFFQKKIKDIIHKINKEDIKIQNDKNYLKGIFSICLILSNNIKKNKPILENFSDLILELDYLKEQSDIILRIKMTLVKYKHWKIIKILSDIRKIYFKHKKKFD